MDAGDKVPQVRLLLLVLLLLPGLCSCQLRILLVSESAQQEVVESFTKGVAETQGENDGYTIDVENLQIDRDNDEIQLNDTCDMLLSGSNAYSAIVDLSWGGWSELRDRASAAGFPYARLEAANHQFVRAADDYLRDRGAIDAALVFSDEPQLDQSLYFLIGNSYIRVVVIDAQEGGAMDRLARMRPAPSYYVAHGDAASLAQIYREAKKRSLVKRDARWTFVFQDWDLGAFVPDSELDVQVTMVTMDNKDCCVVMNIESGTCDCSSATSPNRPFVERASKVVAQTLVDLVEEGKPATGTLSCYSPPQTPSDRAADFSTKLELSLRRTEYVYDEDKMLVTYPLNLQVEAKNSSFTQVMGSWSMVTGFAKSASYEHEPIPRFFRIGTVPTTPWAFKKKDSDGKVIMDENGRPVLDGYCVEMVEELSKRMFFDYELILPTDGREDYGRRDENGTWGGVIGDLVNGEIDVAVAGMTMTSEREEVVDFVAPYFDQSGISIIIRKPVRPRSLFKFMEVLRIEVRKAFNVLAYVLALACYATAPVIPELCPPSNQPHLSIRMQARELVM